MLMDMFYEHVKFEKKQRIHFNAFMLNVHDRKYKYLKLTTKNPTKIRSCPFHCNSYTF